MITALGTSVVFLQGIKPATKFYPREASTSVEYMTPSRSAKSPAGRLGQIRAIENLHSKEKKKVLLRDLLRSESGAPSQSVSAGSNSSLSSSVSEQVQGTDSIQWRSLQENLDTEGFLKVIHQHLAGSIAFIQELKDAEQFGDVSITLWLDEQGKFLKVAPNSDGTSMLTGYVLKATRDAFANFSLPVKLSPNFKIVLHVAFSAIPPSDRGRIERPAIVGRTLNIYRYSWEPNKYVQLVPSTIEGDKGAAVMFNVVAIWQKIFPGQSPDRDLRRLEWDLNFRKREYLRACETQQAEGGCFEAALIEEALGNRTEASRLYKLACTLGLKSSCEKSLNLGTGS